MRSGITLIFAAVFLAHALVASATLSVPSAANSYVTPCLKVCPNGDLDITVTVRDLASSYIPGAVVILDFGACAGAICPARPGNSYVINGNTVRADAGAGGSVTFSLGAGELCNIARLLSVYADGVLLATRTVSSPDQNGDLVVDAGDMAIFNAKVGSANVTADFDCSGTVTTTDRNYVTAHLAHKCVLSVPALPRSWGRVKLLYR